MVGACCAARAHTTGSCTALEERSDIEGDECMVELLDVVAYGASDAGEMAAAGYEQMFGQMEDGMFRMAVGEGIDTRGDGSLVCTIDTVSTA